MASSFSSSSESRNNQPSDSGSNQQDGAFECNICFEPAKEAVVSMCGHLFCWPCLHQWLETRPNRATCPVCKSAIDRDKVVPLYGRGSSSQKDPRDKVPPRPHGQRTESDSTEGMNGFGYGGGGLRFNAGGFVWTGFGAFPFGFFPFSFNFNASPTAVPSTEQQTMSNVFLCIGVIILGLILLSYF